MKGHQVVSREEWLAARNELLVKEKEFTRLRDEPTRLIKYHRAAGLPSLIETEIKIIEGAEVRRHCL